MSQTMYSENGEMYRHEDMGEAVRDLADNLDPTVELPAQFVIYEADFTLEPASYYLPTNIIEQMDEKAYDEVGEEAFGDGLFAQFKINDAELNAEIKAAIDAIFTKRGIQPTAMVGSAGSKVHLIEWRGVDDWSVVEPTAAKEGQKDAP